MPWSATLGRPTFAAAGSAGGGVVGSKSKVTSLTVSSLSMWVFDARSTISLCIPGLTPCPAMVNLLAHWKLVSTAMLIPSSIGWMWPTPGLSGIPAWRQSTVKFAQLTSTGMSVLVIFWPAVGETMVIVGPAAAATLGKSQNSASAVAMSARRMRWIMASPFSYLEPHVRRRGQSDTLGVPGWETCPAVAPPGRRYHVVAGSFCMLRYAAGASFFRRPSESWRWAWKWRHPAGAPRPGAGEIGEVGEEQ